MKRFEISIYWNFTEVCSLSSNSQQTSIGLDYALAASRRHATWTNDGIFHWRIYVPLGLDDLISYNGMLWLSRAM